LRQYENMLLLDSTLEEQEEKDLLNRIVSMMERVGGHVLKTESWGKRKCAYRVEKQTHAYYELIWFDGDSTIVDEIRRQYRIMDEVMKYMIIRPTRPVKGNAEEPDQSPCPPPEPKYHTSSEEHGRESEEEEDSIQIDEDKEDIKMEEKLSHSMDDDDDDDDSMRDDDDSMS